MNRAVSASPTDDLPPARAGGRTRMLFLTLDDMGWSTYASAMAAATAQRDDIDAVHLRFKTQGWKRLVSMPVPRGRNLLDSQSRRVLFAARMIRRWLAGRLDAARFDVIHATPQQYALGFVDTAASGGPPLSTQIDATVLQAKGAFLGSSEAEVHRRYGPLIRAEQAVFDAAALVVASSRWAAVGAQDGFGVPSDKLMVLPMSLPPRAPAPSPAPRAAQDRPRILFVGNDFERKGGDRLLAWHRDHWADRAELHLCTSAPVQAQGPNVHHLGLVAHDELLDQIFPSMDLFVLPTSKDMSPWAVLEAAAAGLPVVSSDIGGIGDMVIDGETGFLRHPDDHAGFVEAIDALLADPDLRQRMGSAGRERFAPSGTSRSGNDLLLDRLVELARRS